MCYSALVRQELKYLEDRYGVSIIRESYSDYERLSALDPKTFRPLKDNPRIFPLYFAPMIYSKDGRLVTEPMRYQAWPETQRQDPKHLTLYNVRLDNLHSEYWKTMYRKHHGFIVATEFYEWVKVKDLLEARSVSLRDVEMEFLRLANARKSRILADGKKYKPTPTEQLPPLERKIIIRLKPTQREDMLIPVIFAVHRLENGTVLKSFAAITDEPPPEVLRAGHDRCPINLDFASAREFVTPPFADPDGIQKLLSSRPAELYDHALDQPA